MIDFEKLLRERGKSKADLARFLDIDPANVNRTIKNDNISLSKIENICSFLDISVIDAFRASGYDDTHEVTTEPAQQKKKILDYKNLLLSLSDQLIELYNNKVLAPYSVVEEKEEKIQKLNREIGKLEVDVKNLKDKINELTTSVQIKSSYIEGSNWLINDPKPNYKSNTRPGIKIHRSRETPIGTFEPPFLAGPVFMSHKQTLKDSSLFEKFMDNLSKAQKEAKAGPTSQSDKETPTAKL